MRSLFIAIAILLSVATFGQEFRTMKRINNVNTILQVKHDTLTIVDKHIRFIIVDGVTYEIVRTTELKKAEVPDTASRFYLPNIKIYGGNITPAIHFFNSKLTGEIFIIQPKDGRPTLLQADAFLKTGDYTTDAIRSSHWTIAN